MSSPIVLSGTLLQQQPQQHLKTDSTVRRRHFRRIPSSQRSRSPPPPPPDRKPISTVIKNVLCLPICRKRKPDEEEEEEEEERRRKAEEDRLEAKLLDLQDSIISSEEQTKAPEGDKLPVFTRLRDWTELQREKEEEQERRRRSRRKQIERQKEEEEDELPTRSVSMPMPVTTPVVTPPSSDSRRRRKSDGQLKTPKSPVWEPQTVRRRDSPVVGDADRPIRKPVPPVDPTTPSNLIKQNPPRVPVQPNPSPAWKDAKVVREARPIIPPKVPVHTGNYGYDAAPAPGTKEYDGHRDPFFSVNLQRLGEILPGTLKAGHQNADLFSAQEHISRNKAKTVRRAKSRHPHTHKYEKYHNHGELHGISKYGASRSRDPAPSSLFVEVESLGGERHHHHHRHHRGQCRKRRHRHHQCRRHHLEDETVLGAAEIPHVVWGGYHGGPVVWQRYDYI